VPPKSKAKTVLTVVPSVYDMDKETLIKHTEHPVTGRHRSTMRFITPNEHQQDHRLNQERLDHTHRDLLPEEEE
jgi:hypothetical protein